MSPRLALVTDKTANQHAGDPRDADGDGDGETERGVFEVTDTSIAFTCALAKLAFDRYGNLQAIFTIDPQVEVSNRDLMNLRGRWLLATLEPQRRGAHRVEASDATLDPTLDPVQSAVYANRVTRLIGQWLSGDDDRSEDDGNARDAHDDLLEWWDGE